MAIDKLSPPNNPTITIGNPPYTTLKGNRRGDMTSGIEKKAGPLPRIKEYYKDELNAGPKEGKGR